jgi:LuxR family glucitol operon transcriptional activator
METKIPLEKLQEDIHRALKSWNDTSTDSSPLDNLQLLRQAKLDGIANARRATNEILLDALEILAMEYEDGATLLRQHFLDGMLMQAIANRLNIGQSTAYRKQQEAIHQLALIIQAKETQAGEAYRASLEKRLSLPPETQLFGVAEKLNNLLERLIVSGTPWLASIEGLGGIGKTSLANAAIRRSELISRFHDVAWVSAKQRAYFPGIGLEDSTSPALTAETLIDSLLAQFGQTATLTQSPQEKKLALTRLLKQDPHLVVIDNLETVLDYQVLVPMLNEIANPSKVLLTSRYSLRAYPDVFCLTLTALNQADAFSLIRHEANLRGLSVLARAADDQLERIYKVVGGNPLALKLVVGQTAFLPLSQVLDNLKAARGKSITDLYTHIYWQTWQMLDDVSQQTLLVMPLAQEGALQHLLTVTRLEPAELHQALQQLATLSLVQVEGDLEARRYSIHHLTETFLLNEAITWQSSA